ncbi:hypothetical protein ETI01_10975 [Macrococcoides caseolyticum]|uniref:hypothetical protein n=1 Tax=Macrococcoides caseolyticum TaxID=69966 RepID=UPI00105D40A4|nr:hypothetical protein [Macrococcus caseolyticus]TDM20923.1 hypothetical protein ETI01_10975 [Macrococcus caseolyticus]
MLNILLIFSLVFLVYFLFLKLYVYIALSLKKSKFKKSYLVDKVLLSSGKDFGFVDFIIVFVIFYWIYFYLF